MQILKRDGQSSDAIVEGVTVTFNFDPKFVVVFSYPYDNICRSYQSVAIDTTIFLYAEGLSRFGSYDLGTDITKNGKSLTFKASGRLLDTSGTRQATWELNDSSATYYFIAFG